MEHATWIKATAPTARPVPNANLPIARTLADFKTPACHQCKHNIHCLEALRNAFVDLLPAWKHGCMFVGALHLERSPDMGPGASASDRAQHLALQAPTSHQAIFFVLEHLVMAGDGTGSQFMHLLRNALHLTLQARCHHCLGCHFELKQVGFTATYRPRQCLLTSRHTFFRYSELGFWSHTGLNLAHGIVA
jgi:hypothetical protein